MTRRKRSKKWLYWVVVVMLIAIAGIVGYKVWQEYFAKRPVNDMVVNDEEGDTSTVVEVVRGGQSQERIDDAEKQSAHSGGVESAKETVEQYDGGDPNGAARFTGAITYAEVDNDDLVIRVNIDQYLENGVCRLELEKDDRIVYGEEAEIVSSATTATCKGFNVPVNQVGQGKINIKIILESGEKTGIIEGEVTL